MQEYYPAPEARATDAVATTAMTSMPPRPIDRPATPSPSVPPTGPVNRPPSPTPQGPRAPAREPGSGLARFVLPLVVMAIGVLGMIDLAGADVAASAYVAVALAIVGLGLVVRAWYGHGWSLAIIGAVLALSLVIVTAAEQARVATAESSTWRPLTVEQLDASYSANVGDAVLDLSSVDFAGQSKDVRVNLDAGNLTVVVSSTVDVRADVQVNVGNAVVFDENWGGIGPSRHSVTNLGSDGPGGGELVLHASVNVGNVEVRR